VGHEVLVRVAGGMVGAAVIVPMTVLWVVWLWKRARAPRD